MARGINKVILIGNLGNAPEVRHATNGNAIASISLATSSAWRDKTSGEMQDRTEWHRVVFFNRLAEIVNEYLHKGSKIYVEGSLRTRKWTDKAGVERYTTEIIANEMQMLDNKGGSSANTSHSEPFNQQHHEEAHSADHQMSNGPSSDNIDDDIPF